MVSALEDMTLSLKYDPNLNNLSSTAPGVARGYGGDAKRCFNNGIF